MKIHSLARYLYRGLALFMCIATIGSVPTKVYAQISEDDLRQIRRGQPLYNPSFESSCNVSGSSELPDNAEVQEQIFQFFLNQGLTAEQAAGIMGNIKEESGFEPQRQQGIFDRLVPAEQFPAPDGDSGWGLVQWTPGTKMIFPVQNVGVMVNGTVNKNPNELIVQLTFLWQQLQGEGALPEKSAGDAVKASSTIEDAVRAFATFERFRNYQDPTNPQYTLRITTARQIFDKYRHLAPGTPNSPAGCSPSGATIDGVECPATMEPHSTQAGYFKMPDAPNGEYTFNGVTPESQRYGSRQLVCVIYTVALAFNTAMQGKSKLLVHDLNASGHDSHYKGIAVDISGQGEWQVASHTAPQKGVYNKDATIALGKMFIDTGAIKNIWWCEPGSDDVPPGTGSTTVLNNYAADAGGIEGQIKCIAGHENHFHVDVKEEFALPGRWEPN